MKSLSQREEVGSSPSWERKQLSCLESPPSKPSYSAPKVGMRPRTKPLSKETGYILLMFGSGFFTDVPGEALGTLAGPPRPWVLGEPEGPLAGDS